MKENETKVIERYNGWMCEKCGHGWRSIVKYTRLKHCLGCKRTIIERVALDDGVVW